MEVRGFLGTAGVVRIWILNFVLITRPLVELTKKDTEFQWLSEHQQAMDKVKDAISTSDTLITIDYTSLPVILAVDSSIIGCGIIIFQCDKENRCRPSRFWSIAWNKRESRYSQAKIELYGLFHAFHSMKLYLIGIQRLTVEMDASYIKGMINNPNMHPDAAMNRWIAAIQLFDFELKHVPAKDFVGPNGLSRR